jgi:hypothetical protein
MATPAIKEPVDQPISRTTSEGRTEVDLTQLLNTQQVRSTYEAIWKLRNLLAHNPHVVAINRFRSELDATADALEEVTKHGSSPEVERLRLAIQHLRQVDTSRRR